MKSSRFSNPLSRILLAAGVGLSLAILAIIVEGAAISKRPDQTLTVTFKPIDIDRFVAEQRPTREGSTSLMQPSPVIFEAGIKQYPHKRKVTYMYTVLEFFPMAPRPEVNHRMFVTTPGGHIMPVYVDDSIVESIKRRLKEGGKRVSFYGYHMYNYSKGPAILVTGFRE